MADPKFHLFRPDGKNLVTMCGRITKEFSTVWPLDADCKTCLGAYLALGEENYHEMMAEVNPVHWVNFNWVRVGEAIPVATCPAHGNGGSPCISPEGHLWFQNYLLNDKGKYVEVMKLCLPKLGNV